MSLRVVCCMMGASGKDVLCNKKKEPSLDVVMSTWDAWNGSSHVSSVREGFELRVAEQEYGKHLAPW